LKLWDRVKKRIQKLFQRKDKSIAVVMDKGKPVAVVTTRKTLQKFRPGQKAISKGYGRFMKKHGKQLPGYRKSKKAKVQPENGED